MIQAPSRFDAIDSAKGIGIVLVVFGHAWRGAFGAGLFPEIAVFNAIDAAIYAFHIPLFFFLSGLVFLDTLAKYDIGALLKGRVTRLLWPMALWTWIFFAIKLFAGGAVNDPVSLSDAPLLPLPPYEHLWFLWALFTCHTGVILLYFAALGRLSRTVVRFIMGAAGIGLAYVLPQLSVPSLVWGATVAHLPFFLIGVAVADSTIEGSTARMTAFLAALVFAGQLWLVAISGPIKQSALSSSLIVLFAWMAWPQVDRGGDTAVLRGLRYLGKLSMVIYLTHTIFSAALRIVMVQLEVDDLALVVMATTGIGLVAPLAVLWAARKARAVKLLGF